MDDLHKYRVVNKLKSVYRTCSVDKRHESSAEHTFGCLLLADFLISKYTIDVNRLKVYELLLYHDLVEIECGDISANPGVDRTHKHIIEAEAAVNLAPKLPAAISEKFTTLFAEYELRQSREAKFAKLIDKLEAQIHELDYKDDWKTWSEAHLRSLIPEFISEFPEIEQFNEDIIQFLRDNGYFGC
jgi:putative hydrolases of HD superfamily